jgi:DNA-binding CsgD family transcriptional regulator
MRTPSEYKQEQHAALRRVPLRDWQTLRSADIAERLGMSVRVVHAFRLDNGLPRQPRKPGSGRPPKHDWSMFDPALSDLENALQLGATLPAVRWHRRHKINKNKNPRP